MINQETRQAYSEVNRILELLGNMYSNKIPNKVKNVFEKERDKEYIPIIDIHKPVNEQNLKRKTIAIISALNLQYWCTDANKKLYLKKKYCENGIKYQEELREKYNPDNVFKNRENIIENIKEKSITEYKQMPILKRIFIKIKHFFTLYK